MTPDRAQEEGTTMATTYETTEADRERERVARAMTECPACERPKAVGAVVCWGACWRGPDGLKDSPLPAGAWLSLKRTVAE